LLKDLVGQFVASAGRSQVELASGVERPIHEPAHAVREHIEHPLREPVRTVSHDTVDPTSQAWLIVIAKELG
jgi:hypothetical protein